MGLRPRARFAPRVELHYNDPAVAKAKLPAAIKDNKKKKPLKGRGNIAKTFHERADSFIHTNAKNEVTNRKRKGARRKKQEKKDESNFTDMVNKYKNKLFARDEGEVHAKNVRAGLMIDYFPLIVKIFWIIV